LVGDTSHRKSSCNYSKNCFSGIEKRKEKQFFLPNLALFSHGFWVSKV